MKVVLRILKGRSVDFKNTIIIMTSNIGSQVLLENVKDAGEISDDTEKLWTVYMHTSNLKY